MNKMKNNRTRSRTRQEMSVISRMKLVNTVLVVLAAVACIVDKNRWVSSFSQSSIATITIRRTRTRTEIRRRIHEQQLPTRPTVVPYHRRRTPQRWKVDDRQRSGSSTLSQLPPELRMGQNDDENTSEPNSDAKEEHEDDVSFADLSSSSLSNSLKKLEDSDGRRNPNQQIVVEASSSSSSSLQQRLPSTAGLMDDFWYGAKYVNDQYLSIVWKYGIVQSLMVVLPFAIVLWGSYFSTIGSVAGSVTASTATATATATAATTATTVTKPILEGGLATGSMAGTTTVIYTALYQIFNALLKLSSAAEYVLQMPFEILTHFVCVILPAMMTSILDFEPTTLIAVPMTHFMLWIHGLVDRMTQSSTITFMMSILASILWRPLLEEWQYRSFLNKIVFGMPEAFDKMFERMFHSTGYGTTSASRSSSNNNNKRDDRNSKSKTSSERSATIQFIPLESGGATAETPESVVDTMIDKTSQSPSIMTWKFPKIPDESTRILLGSLLYATTRLCWLPYVSIDGTSQLLSSSSIAGGTSAYSWTVGFLESIMRHLSPSVVTTAQVAPKVQIWIMLLAIYETVSTFLVAQKVFARIYRQRGLAASVGAHCSWTIGKVTLPFRILWRFYDWLIPSRSASAPESTSSSSSSSSSWNFWGDIVATTTSTGVRPWYDIRDWKERIPTSIRTWSTPTTINDQLSNNSDNNN